MSRQFRSTDTVKWTYGFGRGAYDAVISSNETATWNGTTRFSAYGAFTGTAGQTSFTKPSGWGHEGFCLLHQTRGAGAGNWELAYVDFFGAQAVSDKPLQHTYVAGAQIVALSNGSTGYKNLTINSGVSLVPPAWSGSTGGIIALMAKETVTINGSINTTDRGFIASTQHKNTNGPTATQQGEGSANGNFTESGSANGTGAGGGWAAGGDGGGNGSGGGSGGSKTAGSTGYNIGYSTAAGGQALWGTHASVVSLGGGAGGRVSGGAGDAGSRGTNGAGIVFIFAKRIIISSTGSIQLNSSAGDTGGDSTTYSSGAGGAGSALLAGEVIDINTNKITAIGGAAKGGKKGGDGGIVCMYSKSFTGSSNPTVESVLDTTIKQPGGGNMLLAF